MVEGVLSVRLEKRVIRDLLEGMERMESREIGVLLEEGDHLEKLVKMDHRDYQDEWDQLEKLEMLVCLEEKERKERMPLYLEIN